MRIIPIKVVNGVLKVPDGLKIPPDAQLSILLTRRNEESISILEENKSFSFLDSEPELYCDDDILKNRKNENFAY